MSDVENLEKQHKAKHGGPRKGSGRKPLISKDEIERVKRLIEEHSMDIDPKDKKKRIRILRILDVLYEEGTKKKPNIAALKEYLDRQLGKSKEHVELKGDLPFNITIVKK
jgi:hypothetical protein